jgi:hypothetical protein
MIGGCASPKRKLGPSLTDGKMDQDMTVEETQTLKDGFGTRVQLRTFRLTVLGLCNDRGHLCHHTGSDTMSINTFELALMMRKR